MDEQVQANVVNLLHYFLSDGQVGLDQLVDWLKKVIDNPVDIIVAVREASDDFDSTFDTYTSEVIYPYEMHDDISLDRYQNSVRYVPSPVAGVKNLLDYLQKDFNLKEFVFIDIGSGLGRNVLLASHYDFKKIVGVEISPDLNKIAQSNIKKYRSPKMKCEEIDLECVNALHVSFPQDNMILYFYEPFSNDIADQFFERLQKFIADNKVNVICVFLPIVYPAVTRMPMFRLIHKITPDILGNKDGYFTYYIFSNH